jgi:hypothetical protein
MPLYFAFKGRWPDLAYGITGVWTLDPKLQFQLYLILGDKGQKQAYK